MDEIIGRFAASDMAPPNGAQQKKPAPSKPPAASKPPTVKRA
jgi:hypothetical protein